MSGEKTKEMNENISKRVKWYLFVYFILIISMIWCDKLLQLSTGIQTGDDYELSKSLVEFSVSLLLFIAMSILSFSKDICLHATIDKELFKIRYRTGIIIYDELMKGANEINFPNTYRMKNKHIEVMNLFYHFANNQEVLRSLAFTYWEQYFVNLYIIMYGGVCFITTLIISVIRQKLDIFAFIPVLPLTIATLVCISTFKSLVHKIYELPVKQICEIKSTNRAEFIQELENRFGSKIIIGGTNE